MCDSSKSSLGEFLGFAENIGRWEMKHHLKYIAHQVRLTGYYQTFAAFYKDQMLGVIMFSPAKDFFGVQICYYTNEKYSGKGIGTLLTETLVQKAFDVDNFRYVELHIDIKNRPSQRIAEKKGFEPVVDYDCAISGNSGSGKMQVWVKINQKYCTEITLENFRNDDTSYLAPAYQSLDTVFNAINELQAIALMLK